MRRIPRSVLSVAFLLRRSTPSRLASSRRVAKALVASLRWRLEDVDAEALDMAAGQLVEGDVAEPIDHVVIDEGEVGEGRLRAARRFHET
jgi:hypothetical protein